MVYEVLNEPKKALDYFNQAFSIAHAIRNREYEASSLSSIGEIDFMDRNFEQALERFNQALPMARAVGDRNIEGFLLIHIGETYLGLHKAQESLDPLNQALSILRQISDRDGETLALDDLGEGYRSLGEKQKATEYFDQGLAVAVQANNPMRESDLYHDLMLNERANPPLSIYYGKQAVNYIQQMRGNMQGLDMKLQRRFLTSYQSTYRDLARQLINSGRLPEAQQVLDLLKEQEYSDYVRGEKADAGSLITLTPAEQQAQQDYQKSTGQLIALGEEWATLKKITARTPEQDTRYQQLSGQLDSASKSLNDYYARLYVLFGKNSDANKQIADVKGNVSLLKQTIAKAPHTVALYTMVTAEGYKVIVITGAAMVEREYAIPEKDLNQAVAAFQQVLRQPSADPKPLAQQLYTILIGPVKADLDQAQARTLVFSLDGVLRYVPMAALYDGKQYLVENYSTVTITPVSIPHLAEKPDVSNLNTVAMGISQKYEGGLPPLPSVVGELDDIVSDALVQGAHGVLPGTILLDRQFTEKAMESQLDSPHGVVHIASHFVFKPGDDSQSYLLLSGKDQGGAGFHLTVADFRDNQKLALDDTVLLTLSACETGMGGDASNGREVDGLGTTAQLKGARAVISSLWEVNDSSTGELMADFYKRWVSGAGNVEKVEALRQAQLDLLLGKTKPKVGSEDRGFEADAPAGDLPHGYAHPYYWAPFVLMGNWK
jgi:CHAT domain-containing protein